MMAGREPRGKYAACSVNDGGDDFVHGANFLSNALRLTTCLTVALPPSVVRGSGADSGAAASQVNRRR